MVKGNIENSLKRFLKRRVKFTLGLMVTFLITGIVSFGADFNKDEYPLMDNKNLNSGYLNAMKALNGLGSQIFEGDKDITTDIGKKVDVSGKYYTTSGSLSLTGKITIKRKDDGTVTIDTGMKIKDMFKEIDAKFSFNDRLVSEKVKQNIQNALENAEKGEYKKIGEKVEEERINEFNNGIIMHDKVYTAVQKTGKKSDGTEIYTVTNNGILFAPQGIGLNNSKAINNGIIYSYDDGMGGTGGQTSSNISGKEAKNIELYNNGMIGSNYSGQNISQNTGSKSFNNGVISSKKYGQIIRQSSDKINLYNYGIIEAVVGGQYIESGKNSTVENYGTINLTGNGIITSDNKTIAGQYIENTDNTNSAYNYGLIKVNDSYGMAGTGKRYNYGVIHSADSSVIFDNKGTTTNKGIVITDNQEVYGKDWAKTGITLDSSYNLKNTDTAVDMIKDNTIKNNTLDNSAFTKNIGYVHTNSTDTLKISDIAGKRDEEGKVTEKKLLGVVAEENSTVFEADEDLLLDRIDITGYLINGGTLIDMNNKNLALSGVNITVTEDLTNTKGEKAVAVDLGSGKLSLIGENKINGIIKGGEGSNLEALAQKTTIETNTEGTLTFKNAEADIEDVNYTDITLTGKRADKIVTDFTYTSKEKENTVTISKDFIVGKSENYDYKTETVIEEISTEGNKSNYIIENLDNIHGNIKLGAGENIVTINGDFKEYKGEINLGAGNDTFIVENNDSQKNNLELGINLGAGEDDKFIVKGNTEKDENGNPIKINVFNYKVVNAETIELSGGVWGDWSNAEGSITFDSNTKSENGVKFSLGEETTMNITLNKDKSDFAEHIAGIGEGIGIDRAVITGAGEDKGSVVRYLIGKDGLSTDKFSSSKYSFADGTVKFQSAIFDINNVENGAITVSVKTAEDMGLSEQYRIIYNAYLDQIKTGQVVDKVIDKINGFNSSEDFVNHIKGVDISGRAYYTAGSVVTMDIADTYVSAVEDFSKRAEKGQWLAQGKYLNSDTEFVGGSEAKGYDGDVSGTVGMIEYGFTENTSYGVVFGKGNSEMNIDGGGKLDGDNTYAGAYMKHRTQNGIDLVGNIGYMVNDMDSLLRNDFKMAEGNDGAGSTFEKGTADSRAVVLSLKGKKDYRISDSVKLQPVLGARATLINQEKAENPEMDFTIAQQDIIVLEGTAGMGLAKEIAFSHGKLELNAGAEYTFATANTNNDAEYTLFEKTGTPQDVPLEDIDTAQNTGTVYVGADYEHENGVGFNGKYEMLWSDKGDDSRMTAGMSYRF